MSKPSHETETCQAPGSFQKPADVWPGVGKPCGGEAVTREWIRTACKQSAPELDKQAELQWKEACIWFSGCQKSRELRCHPWSEILCSQQIVGKDTWDVPFSGGSLIHWHISPVDVVKVLQ